MPPAARFGEITGGVFEMAWQESLIVSGGTVSGSGNGLACARVALAADLSARTGKIVSL